MTWLSVVAAVVLLLVTRFVLVLPVRITGLTWCRRQRRRSPSVTTLVVLGSGGHTGEMMGLLTSLCGPPPPGAALSPTYGTFHLLAAITDLLSLQRATNHIRALHTQHAGPASVDAGGDALRPGSSGPQVVCHTLTRAREVGQGLASSLLSTVHALLQAIRLVARVRPDLVLVNGPGTCVPVCLAAFLLRFFGWGHPKIVFVESVCRTRGLSITGRILYPVADRFLVQWPQLQQRYPLSQYVGLLM